MTSYRIVADRFEIVCKGNIGLISCVRGEAARASYESVGSATGASVASTTTTDRYAVGDVLDVSIYRRCICVAVITKEYF